MTNSLHVLRQAYYNTQISGETVSTIAVAEKFFHAYEGGLAGKFDDKQGLRRVPTKVRRDFVKCCNSIAVNQLQNERKDCESVATLSETNQHTKLPSSHIDCFELLGRALAQCTSSMARAKAVTHLNLACAYYSTENYSMALEAITIAENLSYDVEVEALLCRTAIYLGQWNSGRGSSERGDEHAKSLKEALWTAQRALWHSQQSVTSACSCAVEYYDLLLKLALAYHNLGVCLGHSGDTRNEIKFRKKAKEVADGYIVAHAPKQHLHWSFKNACSEQL